MQELAASIASNSSNTFESFYKLFEGLESYLMASKSNNWLKASRFYQLTQKDLLDAIKINPEVRRAFKNAEKNDFCVLRVNTGSGYPENGIQLVSSALRRLGLDKFPIYKDGLSGCALIYLFFDVETDTLSLTKRLNERLAYDSSLSDIDLEFIEGPISIPCQSGFAWLNDSGSVVIQRDEVSELSALTLFLSDYRTKKNSLSRIAQYLDASLEADACSPHDQLDSILLLADEEIGEIEASVDESFDLDCSPYMVESLAADTEAAIDSEEEFVYYVGLLEETDITSPAPSYEQLSFLGVILQNCRPPP